MHKQSDKVPTSNSLSNIEIERSMLSRHVDNNEIGEASSSSSTSINEENHHHHHLPHPHLNHLLHHNHVEEEKESGPSDPITVANAHKKATSQNLSLPKSWLMKGLTTVMQLPNQTPLAALYLTNPKGPMPNILHMQSRDQGRKIPIYLYIPTEENKEDSSISHSGKLPILIDFHGGSFIMGGPLEQAPWNGLCARSGIITICVQYRLGPTWQFPSALLDAEDVLNAILDCQGRSEQGRWLRRELFEKSQGKVLIDETKIAISGFSSGGNIALNLVLSIPSHLNTSNAGMQNVSEEINDEVCCTEGDWPSPFKSNLQTRLKELPVLLFFPSLDLRQAPFDRKRPIGMPNEGEFGKLIGKTLVNAYLPQEMIGSIRASPGLAPLGIKGGILQELLIRQRAAKELDLKSASDSKEIQESFKNEIEKDPLKFSLSRAERNSEIDCLYPLTKALLILPELDNLSEQSEIWVQSLEAANKLEISTENDGSKIGKPLKSENAKIRVHRISGQSHGFTTYPDSFLDENAKQAKSIVLEQSKDFLVNMFK